MTRPPPIRLVVLLEDLEFGGTQRYAVQVLQRIDRICFAPEVWVLRGGADLLPQLQAAGVNVVYLSTGRSVGVRSLIHLAMRLWRVRPDVLYTLTVLPNIWGRLFAGLMRIRLVSGYRSLMPNQHERLLSRFSARIVANAMALKQEIIERRGVPAEQVSVIPNGVDTEFFAPDDDARSSVPLVVCVARLVVEKDIPVLVEAFNHVRERIPDARLDIVGNGPVLVPQAPGVRVLPGTDDVRAHLRRAWVFALASRRDASPNVVLEAMACGVPVVATRVGGIPELVANGETGLLVSSRDPSALGAALSQLLADGAARKTMGDAGRQRALSVFPIAGMVGRTEQVLREVAQLGASWTVTDGGDAPLEVPLWPGLETARGQPEILTERGRFRADRSLRNVTVPTLTLYRAPPERTDGSAVVICPGGGYAALSIDKEGHDVARWFAARGMTALVLKYRLPRVEAADGGIPWPLQDVLQALKVTRAHAADWGIDPRRLGAMGFSAGGHMVAAASYMDRELAFAVLVYPVISMDPAITHKGSRLRLIGAKPAADAVERFSYEHHVDRNTCPTFMVHARDDDVAKVDNSIVYATALERAGVAHEFLLYEKGGHGFGVRGRTTADWPERCLAWLRCIDHCRQAAW
jgi:glycosyltransferase involved in cell wall biosynthesis/dienelactone hydrolase